MALDDVTDIRTYLNELLSLAGLGTLADWAISQLEDGIPDATILQRMRETPEYKERFPGLEARRQAGLPAMSEGDYLRYEEMAKNLMRSANMPEGFYDGPEDFAELIGNNVSLENLSQRIAQGYQVVAQAPDEVKAYFAEVFGPNADSALAAYFLDPDRAESILLEEAAAAEVGGTAVRFGLDLDPEAATRLVRLGRTGGALEAGLARIQQRFPLFNETISERRNLTAEREGVSAELEFDYDATEALNKRLESRVSEFSKTSGTQMTEVGVLGFGRAGR